MHIVFAHEQPLPVATYGGTERILFWLMKALVKNGHRVTLIGHAESKVRELGIELVVGTRTDWHQKIPRDADIVHLAFPWHEPLSKPYVCCIGGNGKPGEVFPQNTIFVSRSHARNHGAESYVYNGLDFDEYPASILNSKGDISSWKSFAFMAKASWKVKNLNDCVRAVRAAPGAHLHVGGGRAWSISPRVHSYGMVGQKQKLEIFAKSDALLWPIRWPEPFGIAMLEAMAAGMAVVASAHGSSAEVINSDVGVLCANYQDFAEAVKTAPRSFKPARLREYAQNTFSAQQMCEGYLACYEKVLSGEPLNVEPPVAQFALSPETLLPF